jgi:hypothetical protein
MGFALSLIFIFKKYLNRKIKEECQNNITNEKVQEQKSLGTFFLCVCFITCPPRQM